MYIQHFCPTCCWEGPRPPTCHWRWGYSPAQRSRSMSGYTPCGIAYGTCKIWMVSQMWSEQPDGFDLVGIFFFSYTQWHNDIGLFTRKCFLPVLWSEDQQGAERWDRFDLVGDFDLGHTSWPGVGHRLAVLVVFKILFFFLLLLLLCSKLILYNDRTSRNS